MRPWAVGNESASTSAMNVTGDTRIHTTYTKLTFQFVWPACTSVVDLNVRSMLADGGRVQLLCDLGTFYIAPDPASYVCTVSGYGAYSVSISAREC